MPSQAHLVGEKRTYDGIGTTDKTISKPESGQDNQIPPIPCRRMFHMPDNINHRVLSLDAFRPPGLPRAKNGLLFILRVAVFFLHTGSGDTGNTDQLSHAASQGLHCRLYNLIPDVYIPVMGTRLKVNKTAVAK